MPPERSVSEWLAHPAALVELYVVVMGWATINDLSAFRLREARMLSERLADLPDVEQRRVARVAALRERLAA